MFQCFQNFFPFHFSISFILSNWISIRFLFILITGLIRELSLLVSVYVNTWLSYCAHGFLFRPGRFSHLTVFFPRSTHPLDIWMLQSCVERSFIYHAFCSWSGSTIVISLWALILNHLPSPRQLLHYLVSVVIDFISFLQNSLWRFFIYWLSHSLIQVAGHSHKFTLPGC